MAGVGFIAAPALFATLARSDAGRAASRLFAVEAMVGLALGALLLIVTMQRARLDAEAGRGSRFSTDMVLALVALFCVVAGHYGLQPMIESAREPSSIGPSFAALHGASTVLFGVRFLVASALAWRLTDPPAAMAAAKTSSG